MSDWPSALETFSTLFNDASVPWLLVGSAACAIRGCDFIPGDLDILLSSYDDLEQCLAFFKAADIEVEDDIIKTQSFPTGFIWHKVYAELMGSRLDISFIESGGPIPDGENGVGVWEGGKTIWKISEPFHYRGVVIQLPPLLVQFESHYRRDRMERADMIRERIHEIGFSEQDAKRLLSTNAYTYLIREDNK